MDIKFKELEKVQGEKNGKVWTAFKIHGVKLEDGSDWSSTNIFDNQYNEELLGKLEELEAGEKYAILHKKNDQGYWTVSGVGEVSEDKPSGPPKNMRGKGTKSGTGKGGDTMSKEEWAAKNEVDRIRIAKSVALKAAVENTKVGHNPEGVVEMAQAFMPFLTDDALPLDIPFDVGEDGLDAPEV